MTGNGKVSTWARIRRIWVHRMASEREVRATFHEAALGRIEAAIAAGENSHRGEVRFAVEAELGLRPLWIGTTPRERALQVFSEHGIWDTEENSGVLIYLLWADHAVEIIADRAANRCLPGGKWKEICDGMAQACREGRHVDGVVSAIQAVNDALETALPAAGGDQDELPNRSIVL